MNNFFFTHDCNLFLLSPTRTMITMMCIISIVNLYVNMIVLELPTNSAVNSVDFDADASGFQSPTTADTSHTVNIAQLLGEIISQDIPQIATGHLVYL